MDTQQQQDPRKQKRAWDGREGEVGVRACMHGNSETRRERETERERKRQRERERERERALIEGDMPSSINRLSRFIVTESLAIAVKTSAATNPLESLQLVAELTYSFKDVFVGSSPPTK